MWRKRSYREKLQEQSQETHVIFTSFCHFLPVLLLLVFVFFLRYFSTNAQWWCSFLFPSFYCVFYAAGGGGVILDHQVDLQVDLAHLSVAAAAAQVIVEVEATGL